MDLGLSFTSYLKLLTPGGVLAIVAVLAMVPFSFQSIWRISDKTFIDLLLGN
jgi:Na+/H+ antiporter NhaD/arsenite permease-like protein